MGRLAPMLLGGVCMACGVPDVSFLPLVADASYDAPAEVMEAAAPEGASAAEGGASEAAAGGCPSAPPSGYQLCCGAIACGGGCGASDCAKCSACVAPAVCCVHAQGVACNAIGPCK